MQRKRPTAARIAAAAAVFLIAAVLCAGLILGIRLGKIGRIGEDRSIDRSEEIFEAGEDNGGKAVDAADVDLNGDEVDLLTGENVKNILLIGTDEVTEEGGTPRSDSMIICSIDTVAREIKLISLMRDTYVSIPGFSDNRLNAAYAFGGVSLLDDTIEKNFGIRIDWNVSVDYASFVEAVAKIGELRIDLDEDEVAYLKYDPEYGDPDWDLDPGENFLTPEQALAYARMRRVGRGDFTRTERQRKIIASAFDKISGLSVSGRLSLANAILPCISTDMSYGNILGCAFQLAVGRYSLADSLRIPVDGAWEYAMINGYMSVVLPDLPKNSAALQEFIYGAQQAQADK